MEDGRIVNYTYDANGNLTSVTPPGGTAHTFAYSAVNKPTAYAPPVVAGGGATTYSFSPDRELTKMTRPDGQVINYNYDAAGRAISLASPSTTISFSYDSITGNRSSASVAAGEAIGYSYNGSLPTGSTWTGVVGGNVGRSYNNNFWVTSETINGGNSVAFTYDKDGLVSKAGLLTLKYNAKTGFNTGSTLATIKDTITYNTFAEPTAHTAKHGTAVLYKAAYTRDNIGRITTLKDTIAGTTTTYAYAYDNAGRLVGVKKNGVAVASYTYDSNSNRLSAITPSGTLTGTYDAQDRQLTYGNASYTYTANGELATKTVGSQVTTYQYDAFGNLTVVTLPNSSQITYVLDAEGNRVGRSVNGALTGFLYDGGNLVAELDANNQLVSQFIYGSDNTSPDYMVAGGTAYRIFSDHLGSPRLVINSSTGQVAERIDYDEFGNVINDTNPGFQPFGFAGGLYDPDTKMVHFGARDYDPGTGRWITIDPILFSGGDSNLYGYVMNDPVNLADPTGLMVWICRDGNNIMMIVGVNFTGPGATPDAIKGMTRAIESRWTGKFGPYNVHTSVVNTTAASANVINVHSETGRGSMSELGDRGKGEWYQGTDVAHEAGHIMGLPDRYHDVRNGTASVANRGWKGNVMAKRFGKVQARDIKSILKNFPVCPCH
jgi:RHS repeat-associated protein